MTARAVELAESLVEWIRSFARIICVLNVRPASAAHNLPHQIPIERFAQKKPPHDASIHFPRSWHVINHRRYHPSKRLKRCLTRVDRLFSS